MFELMSTKTQTYMNQQQTQSQKQILKFSPLQIQLLNLLQLNSLAIEQRIKDEIEENPALEEGKEEKEEERDEDAQAEDDVSTDSDNDNDFDLEEFLGEDYGPDYRTISSNNSKDDETYTMVMSQRITFQDQIKEQLQSFQLSDSERKIVNYLVDSLDEDGYLRTLVSEIVDDISFAESIFAEEEDVQRMIHTIQKCDPPGVGAQTLKECLLIQLRRRKNQDDMTRNAILLLTDYFQEFSNKNYEKIIRDSGMSHDELKNVLNLIVHLNPKPVAAPGREDVMKNIIIPEFQVVENDGTFDVLLTNQTLPELRMNRNFMEMVETIKEEKKVSGKKSTREALQFVKQKINSAKWFIDAIHQRQVTMLRTMETIVQLQKEFFSTGDFKNLKPMILKDVAECVDMDISTISRVTSTKYVQTAFGTFRIKDFFTSVLVKDDGEEVSNKEIQEIISELVQQEDKESPLTDLEISTKLRDQGYHTARRTVAKYREHIGIPIARLRKKLS